MSLPQASDSAAAVQPRTLQDAPQRWLLVVLMHIGMLVCYVHRGALSVAVPFMIKDLGLSTTVAGFLLSAFFWPYSFMQSPAGWAVDRFGVKRVYAWGYAVWSLGAAVTGLGRNLLMLAAARGLLGVGQSVIFPTHARAIANWFSAHERGTATGIANSGSRLGQAAVNGFGPLLIAAIGWRYFFLTTSLLPLIWLLPWLLFMNRWDGGAAMLEKTDDSPWASFFASFALLKQRSMLGTCLGYFCYNYAWILLYTWLPGYLVVERKFSPQEMAFFSSIPYLAGFVIALSAGVLADWFVRRGFNELRVRKIFMTSGMAGACVMVLAGMTDDKLTAVWLLGFAVCSLSISGISSWVLTQTVCERQIVGTVGGLQNFSGNIGGIIAPALTGFIADKTGSFALALSLTSGLLVVGIVIYWLLVAERIRQQAAE